MRKLGDMRLIDDWGSQARGLGLGPGDMAVRMGLDDTTEGRTGIAIEGLSTDGKWMARAFLTVDVDQHLTISRLEVWPSSTSVVAEGVALPSGLSGDVLRHLPLGSWLARARGELTDAEFVAQTGAGYDPMLEGMGYTDASANRKEWARRLAAQAQSVMLPRGRLGYPDDHYRRIALAYLDLQRQGVSRGIQKRLAEQEGCRPQTINDWLHTATKKGFLTPGKQGRAGRDPGPNLYDHGASEES